MSMRTRATTAYRWWRRDISHHPSCLKVIFETAWYARSSVSLASSDNLHLSLSIWFRHWTSACFSFGVIDSIHIIPAATTKMMVKPVITVAPAAPMNRPDQRLIFILLWISTLTVPGFIRQNLPNSWSLRVRSFGWWSIDFTGLQNSFFFTWRYFERREKVTLSIDMVPPPSLGLHGPARSIIPIRPLRLGHPFAYSPVPFLKFSLSWEPHPCGYVIFLNNWIDKFNDLLFWSTLLTHPFFIGRNLIVW